MVGEYTKYGLVFASTITGSVAGHFYTNRATSLRMWLERKGNKLLRASDPLWMYERMVKRNKEKIKKLLNNGTDSSDNDKTNEELAFDLMNWCQDSLSDKKWNLQKEVIEYCEHPYK